jgi:hypothetical protein
MHGFQAGDELTEILRMAKPLLSVGVSFCDVFALVVALSVAAFDLETAESDSRVS